MEGKLDRKQHCLADLSVAQSALRVLRLHFTHLIRFGLPLDSFGLAPQDLARFRDLVRTRLSVRLARLARRSLASLALTLRLPLSSDRPTVGSPARPFRRATVTTRV